MADLANLKTSSEPKMEEDKQSKEIVKKSSIEDIFQSKGRIKILKLLVRVGELNISAIVDQTHLNHKSAYNHLQALIQANLVEKKEFGRIRIYRFKLEILKAKSLKYLFDIWENSHL